MRDVEIVETVLRLILKLHMPEVELVRFLPRSRSCVLRLPSGRGVSPSAAILALEVSRHVRG